MLLLFFGFSWALLIAPNGKRETLNVTSEHPFFVKGKGWTEVRKLAPGDQIISGKGGFLAIANMRSESQPTLVYNFEVAQNHNYFAGGEGALAHNAGYGNSLNSSKLTSLYELIKAATGDRIKCGISNNPDKRYPKWWLKKHGYELRVIGQGQRRIMREIERGENLLNPGPLVKRP